MKRNLSLSRRSFVFGTAGVGTAQRFGPGNWLRNRPVRWSRTFADESAIKPITVVDDLLLLSGDEKLLAVATGSGELRWERAVATTLAPSDVCRVGPETICIADSREKVVGIDVDSGEPKWEFAPNVQIDSLTRGTDGALYVVAEKLYALSEDGRTEWSHAAETPFVGSPVVHDDSVLVGTQRGTVFSLSTEGGDVRWQHRRPTRGADVSTVGVATAAGEPRVLVWERGDGERLSALAADSGEHRWTMEFEGTTQWFMGTVTDDTIYVSHGQSLLALSTADGRIRWEQTTEGEWAGPPVMHGETVFASTGETLYAFADQDGRERWHRKARDGLLVVPDVDGLYHYSEGTTVRGLSPTDGAVRWKANLEAAPVGLLGDDGITYVGTESGTAFALVEQASAGVSADVPSVLLGGGAVLGVAGYAYYRWKG